MKHSRVGKTIRFTFVVHSRSIVPSHSAAHCWLGYAYVCERRHRQLVGVLEVLRRALHVGGKVGGHELLGAAAHEARLAEAANLCQGHGECFRNGLFIRSCGVRTSVRICGLQFLIEIRCCFDAAVTSANICGGVCGSCSSFVAAVVAQRRQRYRSEIFECLLNKLHKNILIHRQLHLKMQYNIICMIKKTIYFGIYLV